MHNLQSNIWKFFVYSLTLRRHYFAILSIYFLTLPNTTAKMIGLYSGIGSLFGFLLEIPSGYFADTFGHKRTLILGKVCMLFSTLSFIFVQNFWGFVLGSAFLSVSFAFHSGASSAFMHETLDELGRKKDYTKVMGKIRGNVSLLSMILIIALPFFTEIDIVLPLVINLFFDIIGLVVSFTFVNPQHVTTAAGEQMKSILQVCKEARALHFFPFATFMGAITGFLIAASPFRDPYLVSLGYPIIFIGFVMGLSRFVWFGVGHYAYLIEKHLSMKQHLLFDMVFFTGYFLLSAYLSHPYLVALIFIIGTGYLWGRTPVIENYVFNKYTPHKKYKATVISIQSQIRYFFQLGVMFAAGFVMNYSYQLGFYAMGGGLFCILGVSYLCIKKD